MNSSHNQATATVVNPAAAQQAGGDPMVNAAKKRRSQAVRASMTRAVAVADSVPEIRVDIRQSAAKQAEAIQAPATGHAHLVVNPEQQSQLVVKLTEKAQRIAAERMPPATVVQPQLPSNERASVDSQLTDDDQEQRIRIARAKASLQTVMGATPTGGVA